MAGTSVTPQQPSPVDRAFDSLDGSIAGLEDTAKQLVQRLSPVLSPNPPAGGATKVEGDASGIGMVNEIASRRYRVIQVRDILADLVERLAI